MDWIKDRALSMLLFAGGFAALGITVMVNRHFGVQQAATAEGQLLSGSMTVYIDIALVLLGITSGAFFRSKDTATKAMGVFAFLLMLACALASVTSILGFLGAERLSVSKAREKQQQISEARVAAEAAAKKQALDAQIKLAEDNAKWMRSTANQKGMGRSERTETRRDMMDGMAKSVEAIGKVAVAAPEPAKPMEILLRPDGQTELIAGMTGINKQTLQLTILTYISVLMVVLKSSFFPLGAWRWPRKPELPRAVTDPIKHGLTDEAHVELVNTLPPLEPPPGQRMLPAPLTRPEPPPAGKAALARIGFPKTKPEGDPRPMTDEERETVGLRMLTWMTANAIRGEFAQDVLWQLFKEFWAAQGHLPMAERHAKPALEAVNKGRKYYATKTATSPVVWSIRLPDFEELNYLLDRAGFPAAPKTSRAKAEKPSPTNETKPQAEEIAPETGDDSKVVRPFVGSAPAAGPSTKREQRFHVDIAGQHSAAREQKRSWQARMFARHRKQTNRMSRARSA